MLCTNGAPSLCTSMKMNALDSTQPPKMTSAPHPRTVHHARRYLNHLSGDERHHDLEKLKPQKDEEAHRSGVADVGDDAVYAAWLEQLVDIGPQQNAHQPP